MDCNRAGELLGAFRRKELPPSTRAELDEHLDRCPDCRDEYEVDRLISELPRVAPSAALRSRIFSSPEFLELTRTMNSQRGYSAGENRSPEAPAASAGVTDDEARGQDRFPHLIPLRPDGHASQAGSNGNGHLKVTARGARRRPDVQRVTLRLAVAAAVLVLVLGSALGIKTLLGKQATTAALPAFNLADPIAGPLAAGNRVVYLHDGRLWSALEHGPQTRAPLTDKSIAVAPGWAVAPAAGPDGTHHLAYIDLKTGKLHSIQTDDANDVILGTVTPAGANLTSFWSSAEGQAILAGLAWSPDARQLAFVADRDETGAALWVNNADGSGARAVSGPPAAGALPELPAWASDSLNLAYVLAQPGATGIWNVTFDGQPAQPVVERASPQGDAGAVVRGLYWTSDTTNPTVTWSAGAQGNGPIKSLWSYRLAQTPHLMRLTPAGATFSAVDYSQLAGGTGSWLVAQVGRGVVSVHADGSAAIGLASGHMVAVKWAPTGAGALYLVAEEGASSGALWTWTPVLGQGQIADGVALNPLPAWSPDGQEVLAVSTGQAFSAAVGGKSFALASMGNVTALAWAPDGARVALAGAKGVEVSDASGGAANQVDNVVGVSALVWTAVP